MNLKKLLDLGSLKNHKTSKKEINDLIKLIKRDIKDAKINELSCDRRFAIAYNASLQGATILLYCKGYKSRGAGHHFTTFQAMKEILGSKYHKLADYFDSCRVKRNIMDYSYTGRISESETFEIINETEKFLKIVKDWIKNNYSNLL
ncbi:SAV_6107 family HEPN domain-containing protein [Elusimicrobiota bacterium]